MTIRLIASLGQKKEKVMVRDDITFWGLSAFLVTVIMVLTFQPAPII